MRRRAQRLNEPGPGPARRPRRGLVQVLVRAPVPGRVKTRLAAAIGPAGALQWHLWSLHRTLRLAATLPGADLEIWVDGDRRDVEVLSLARAGRARLRSQPSGDLGRRLALAARSGLRRHGRVLQIGADCLSLQPEHLRLADDWLAAGGAAVLAPAEDGGYVMIGLGSRGHGRVFRRIDWGSGRVLAQTRAALREIGWDWLETETLWDLDRPEDLARPALAAIDPARPGTAAATIRRTATRRNRRAVLRTGHRVLRTRVPRNS